MTRFIYATFQGYPHILDETPRRWCRYSWYTGASGDIPMAAWRFTKSDSTGPRVKSRASSYFQLIRDHNPRFSTSSKFGEVHFQLTRIGFNLNCRSLSSPSNASVSTNQQLDSEGSHHFLSPEKNYPSMDLSQLSRQEELILQLPATWSQSLRGKMVASETKWCVWNTNYSPLIKKKKVKK